MRSWFLEERVSEMSDAHKIIRTQKVVLAQILLSIILAAVLFWPTIKAFILEWYHNPNSSHGFLIPFVLFFLIYRKKEEIKPLVTTGKSGFALMTSILGLLFYFIGRISLVLILERVGFMTFLISSSIFIIGNHAAKKISFPIAYSLFMIPIPVTLYDYLTYPMKKFATYASVKILFFFPFPVYREGNVIHLANSSIEVVNACSGLSSLMSILVLGTFWGYFKLSQNGKRWLFAFMLIPAAIFANVIRITITAIISNYYGVEFWQGLLHEFYGTLLVIVVASILMIPLSRLLK
jgi:exosortase